MAYSFKKFFLRSFCIFMGIILSIGGLFSGNRYKNILYWEALAAEKFLGEEKFFDEWSEEDEFCRDYAVELEKEPGKDFVILNLTDIQLIDSQSEGAEGEFVRKTIEKMVKDEKPDLITMTGDNAWQSGAYMDIAKYLSSLDIPWAPIMGNHDGQGCPDEFWCAYVLANSKNSLFKFGPENMGYGNYIINITENGKIIHTLFMTDTHSDADYPDGKGGTFSDYDHLWQNQFDWYRWAVNGIKKIDGKTVESTVFMHIPVYEFLTVLNEGQYDTSTDTFKNPDYADAFGVCHETPCPPPVNTGFFALCKELGSTKNIIAGHDHRNDFSVSYQGIRLTYALKCGAGCYWEEELNGGTKISINSDGNALVEHIYVK